MAKPVNATSYIYYKHTVDQYLALKDIQDQLKINWPRDDVPNLLDPFFYTNHTYIFLFP